MKRKVFGEGCFESVVFLGMKTQLDPCDLQGGNQEVKHHKTTELTDLIHFPWPPSLAGAPLTEGCQKTRTLIDIVYTDKFVSLQMRVEKDRIAAGSKMI